MSRKRVYRLPIVLVLTVALGIPVTLAKKHTVTVSEALELAETGKLNEAKLNKLFKKDLSGDKKKFSANKDALLATFELGALNQRVGNFKQSKHWFDLADSTAKEIEGQAVVSGKKTTGKAGAATLGESSTQYVGDYYEKVMSRTLNALNYAFLGDMEGAGVELRKAENYHREARDAIQKEIDAAEKKAQKKADKAAKKSKEDAAEERNKDTVDKNFGALNAAISDVRNDYENAFTYYLSAQFYLANGDSSSLNDAWNAAERAWEIGAGVSAIESLYRDVARMQFAGDPETLAEKLGEADASVLDVPRDAVDVTVIYLAGNAPMKSEKRLPVVIATGAFQTATVSSYEGLQFGLPEMSVQASGVTATTDTAVYIGKLAAKAHKKKLPGMVARAAVRGVTKGAATKAITKKAGPLGKLLGSVVSNATEHADFRAWYSMPAEVKIARLALPPGSHTLQLSVSGRPLSATANGEAGDHCIVLVWGTGATAHAWTLNLSRPPAS